MGQDTQELKREIAETRHDLGETLDEIGNRITPSRIVERQRRRVSQRWWTTKEKVMGTTHHAADSLRSSTGSWRESATELPENVRHRTEGSPFAMGTVVFGVGLLAGSLLTASRRERELAHTLAGTVGEPLREEVMAVASETAEHLREPARHAAEEIVAEARSGARDVGGAVTGQASASTTGSVGTDASGREFTT